MCSRFCTGRVRVAARIRLFVLEKDCLYSPQQAGAAAEPAAPVVGDVFGFVEELAVMPGSGFHLVYLLVCCFDGLIIHVFMYNVNVFIYKFM